MTSPHGPSPEDRLTDALQRTADQTTYDATSLSTITTRAARIRRQGRRRAALAAATAVAVVAVPTAVLLRPDDEPVPTPLDRTPSATSTPSVPAPPKPTKTEIERFSLDPKRMPVGPPPKLGYAANGKYVSPDGEEFPTPPPGGPLGHFAQTAKGLLYTETTYGMSNEGEQLSLSTYFQPIEGQAEFVGCSDGLNAGNDEAVAYLISPCPGSEDPGRQVLNVVDSAGRTTTRPLPATDAYLELKLFRVDEVIVQDSSTRQLWAIPPRGAPQKIDSLETWKPKNAEIVSFSPDGRHVLLQGTSWPGNTIADAATGKVLCVIPLTQFSGQQPLWKFAWEDNEHLLGTYPPDDRAYLLRVDLSGALEVAADLPLDARLSNAKGF